MERKNTASEPLIPEAWVVAKQSKSWPAERGLIGIRVVEGRNRKAAEFAVVQHTQASQVPNL